MAKARKAAKRAATKSTIRSAKLKGRKVAKPKAGRAKKRGAIAGAVKVVTDAVRLRTRLGGHNRFEDQ